MKTSCESMFDYSILSVGYCPISLRLCLYARIQTFTEGVWVWVDGTAATILSSTDKELIVVSSWGTSLTIVKDCSSFISRIIPRWVRVSTKCFLNTAEQLLARWLTHTGPFFVFNWVTEQQWSEVIPTWRGFGGFAVYVKQPIKKGSISYAMNSDSIRYYCHTASQTGTSENPPWTALSREARMSLCLFTFRWKYMLHCQRLLFKAT